MKQHFELIEPAARMDTGHADTVRHEPPRQHEIELSKAISLKRLADAVCGDEKNSGIIHALFDIIARQP